MEPIINNDNTNECPICLLTIDTITNCTITSCGHKFHTSCFTRNVIHNKNADCPCCRQCSIHHNADDEELIDDTNPHAYDPNDYNTDDDIDYDTEDDTNTDIDSAEEDIDYTTIVEEAGLRAMRFMFTQMDGEEHDVEDDIDEDQYVNYSRERAKFIAELNSLAETDNINTCVKKCTDNHITYTDLVTALLSSHIDNKTMQKKSAYIHQKMVSNMYEIMNENIRKKRSLATPFILLGEIDI